MAVYNKESYNARKKALTVSYQNAKRDYIEYLEMYTAICMREGCDLESIQVRCMSKKLSDKYAVMFEALCRLQSFKLECYYV